MRFYLSGGYVTPRIHMFSACAQRAHFSLSSACLRLSSPPCVRLRAPCRCVRLTCFPFMGSLEYTLSKHGRIVIVLYRDLIIKRI
jgi:hypothetical protein